MTATVKVVPASSPTAAPNAALGAGASLSPAVRGLSARADFRALLRDDRLAAPLPAVGLPQMPLAIGPSAGPSHAQAFNTSSQAPGEAVPRGTLQDDGDPLDPMMRHHASLGSPATQFSPPSALPNAPLPMQPRSAAAPDDTSRARASASLEELLPALVRRVAFSGDGKRGTMRLEIGAGPLAGSTLLVHADGAQVRVRLDVAPGAHASDWQERIERRLKARGISADSVEVA